jgi:hypothetical protein
MRVIAWIKTLVKFPEKFPSTMGARGRSTERVKYGKGLLSPRGTKIAPEI